MVGRGFTNKRYFHGPSRVQRFRVIQKRDSSSPDSFTWIIKKKKKKGVLLSDGF